MVINWNVIFAHRWTPELYDDALHYLTTNQIPQRIATKGKSVIHTFKQRMKHYQIKNNKIVILANDIPYWLIDKKTKQPIVLYTQQLPLEFEVVRDKNEILDTFFKDPKDIALSKRALFDKIIRSFYIGISRRDIDAYLKSRDDVQQHRTVPEVQMVKSFRPLFPFQFWQMDITDMTERSIQDNEYIYTDENGHVIRTTYRYILVIIDIFSKFVYAYPLENKQGLLISKILMKLFLSGDIPMILHSDNAIEFSKGHVKDVCDMFHVQQRFGDAYSPQTQGFVENKNKHIKDIIKYYFTYFKSYKFFDILDRIVFSINNTKHSVTRYTPMQIHKGREIPTKKNETVVEQVDEVNPCDVQLYSNSSEVFYKDRTEKIQNILKYTADKKEEKLKVKQDFLNKNVKVFSYLKNDSSIIPILLRRVKNEYIELIENPIDIGKKPIDVVRFYKLVGKLKLSKSKYYHDVYKIKSVNDNKFTMVSQDLQYKIERFVNSQWTDVFHKNMFTIVKDTKVIDRPEYRFVDLQNKMCKDTIDIVQKKRLNKKDFKLSQQQLIEILDSNILLSNPKPLIHYMFDSNKYEVIFAKSRQDDRMFEISKVADPNDSYYIEFNIDLYDSKDVNGWYFDNAKDIVDQMKVSYNENKEYEVQKIIARRKKEDGSNEYLLRFVDHGPEFDLWLPPQDSYKRLIKEYEKVHGK